MPKKTVNKKQKTGDISKSRMQKEQKKQSNLGAKIAIFFISMVVIGLSIGILFSPAFNLTKVIVENGTNVTSSEILNIIEVSYGENILKQKYGEIKKAVLSLPYVSDAKISIRFPDKIKITYKEREPYAIIKFLETFFVTDVHGYLLENQKEKFDSDMTVIYGIGLENYELGQQLDDVSGLKYKNIVQLLETVKQKNIPYTISEIDYGVVSEVKLWIEESDIEIIYGEIKKEILIDKLNYLAKVLNELIVEGKKGRVDISSDAYYKETIFTDINNI